MADNDAFRDVVAAVAGGRATALKASDGAVSLMLDVSGMTALDRATIEAEVRSALAAAGAQSVRVMLTAERIAPRLIAVASGKGGVGKSTLSANLAVTMARSGRAVGLVDADIYGPSQPRLLGAEDGKPEAADKKMFPVIGAGGVPFL